MLRPEVDVYKRQVYDLMKVEHTYAPPFSSAKDPIAIAGYTANNIISGADVYKRQSPIR